MFKWVSNFQNFMHASSEVSAFSALTRQERGVVFYAESHHSWPFFEPIIKELLEKNIKISYLTSEIADPVLLDKRIRAFYVGDGGVRTAVFKALDAMVMVMTMPDLETYHIKRSPKTQNYIYVHHSMVSTHMIYTETAFDGFDTIFCVGPHHVEEIRKRESLYNLKKKELVEHGYGRLDSLLLKAQKKEFNHSTVKKILLAPSWGPNGILELFGTKIVKAILDANFELILRPHPMTKKKAPLVIESILKEFSNHPNFKMDSSVASEDSLYDSDVMISDWSGAALEFAFALEKPVVFLNTPRKINNKNYEKLELEPLEVHIRNGLGKVVEIQEIDSLGEVLSSISRDFNEIQKSITTARDKYIFNVSSSGRKAADYIISKLDSKI